MLSRLFVLLFASFLLIVIPNGVIGVDVYVMDSGVRMDHEKFLDSEVESIDVFGDDNVAKEEEFYGDHGTLMAGIIIDRAPDAKLRVRLRRPGLPRHRLGCVTQIRPRLFRAHGRVFRSLSRGRGPRALRK